MPTTPLHALAARGQSAWQDNLTRAQIQSGDLRRVVVEEGIRGVTTNPAIFQKAIGGSSDYDTAIRDLALSGKKVSEILDLLVIADVTAAADILRPVWENTQGRDGFVSIEVGAEFARDTERTIAEATRLWRTINRPNLMVKIPGTVEGLAAIRQCLSQGININVTLLFSIARYEAVAFAFIEALEDRAQRGLPVDKIASVASFFVSRVDTIVDQALTRQLPLTTSTDERSRLQSLVGTVAIANARCAYVRFEEIFSRPRFLALAKNHDAQVQRPLWASTSMKNPARRDVLYVEDLVGPNTVNTLPPATIAAFCDHGEVRGDTIRENRHAAARTLQALQDVGLNLDALTDQLEFEGINLFAAATQTLVTETERKIALLTVS